MFNVMYEMQMRCVCKEIALLTPFLCMCFVTHVDFDLTPATNNKVEQE